MNRDETIERLSSVHHRIGAIRQEVQQLFDLQFAHPNPDSTKLDQRRQELYQEEEQLDAEMRELSMALQ